MQSLWVERQQHLHHIHLREAQGLLSEQEKLSIKWELERFRAAEEKFWKVMESDHK